MIIVLEPTLRGPGHSALNAGLVTTLLRAFPSSPVVFLGDEGHIAHVCGLLAAADRQRVEFVALDSPSPLLPRLSARQARQMLKRQLAPHLNGADSVYILTASIHRSIVQLVREVVDNLRVTGAVATHFILHGTNRGNFLHRSRNPLLRWRDLPAAVSRYRRDQVRYLVLDEATAAGWVSLCPRLADRLGVLEIALDDSEARGVGFRHQRGFPVRFGLLGQATAAKGFFEFRQLARRFSSTASSPAEFHIIGRIGSGLAGEPRDNLLLHSPNVQIRGQPPAQMPRSEYIAAVSALDYACLLYAGDYYDSGASGVFFDAVNLARPIIAKPTRFVEQAFERFGDIGFLCRTDDEVDAVVAGILAGEHAERYPGQVEALLRARGHWLPESIARRFRAWLIDTHPQLAGLGERR